MTPGQAHDVQGFRPLMRMVADRIDALLADKGYDADAIRDELADANVEAVQSPTSASSVSPQHCSGYPLSTWPSLFPILDEAMMNRLQPNGEIVWLHGGAIPPIDRLVEKDFSIVIEGTIDAFIVRKNRRTHLAKLGRGNLLVKSRF